MTPVEVGLPTWAALIMILLAWLAIMTLAVGVVHGAEVEERRRRARRRRSSEEQGTNGHEGQR